MIHIVRPLSGQRDARRLELALGLPRFQPFVQMLEELGLWCRETAKRHADLLSPRILRITNGELFGPLLAECFRSCATASAERAARDVPRLLTAFQAFFSLFLARLARDARAGVFRLGGYHTPITGLWAHGEETHNGRQRVLQVRFRRGGALAYKPRPAGGEKLFVAEGRNGKSGSLFDLLNALPAASGAVRLPTIRVLQGRGRDRRAYSWQEWIERPVQWGTIRRARGQRLEGTCLRKQEADLFWHRAGSLSAVCFAFGIVDLGGGNVLPGRRSRGRKEESAESAAEPMVYAIDLEVFFYPIERLWETHLVGGPQRRGRGERVAFERSAEWHGVEGPGVCFLESPSGRLRLVRSVGRWGREEARDVIADREGNVGPGAHLAAYLRGMFDVWTLLNLQKERIVRFVRRASNNTFVRILARPTAIYVAELERMFFSLDERRPRGVRYDAEERAQLERLDVPYFFRRATGGPFLCQEPPPKACSLRECPAPPFGEGARFGPSEAVRSGSEISFVNLGVAVRDAIEHVLPELPRGGFASVRHGIRLERSGPRSGEISFDWGEAGKRFTYAWNQSKIRLRVDSLDAPAAAAPKRNTEIRRELLRIDEIDREARKCWADGRFRDRALGARLEVSTASAVEWLKGVVRAHGWPGFALVGSEAADAACRLVQHVKGHIEFRRRCLELIEHAARKGDMTLRHVAYLTDSIRLDTRRQQLYGTKFREKNGLLVPYPIAEEAQVDQRRMKMGLEPLSVYAARLAKTFSIPAAPAR